MCKLHIHQIQSYRHILYCISPNHSFCLNFIQNVTLNYCKKLCGPKCISKNRVSSPPVLQRAVRSCSHLAVLVSAACDSSACRPAWGKWHLRALFLQDLLQRSQKVGSCSCQPAAELKTWTPLSLLLSHICSQLGCGGPWEGLSDGCTPQSTPADSQMKPGWSHHTQRWWHGRFGSNAPPYSSWSAPVPLCPRSATENENAIGIIVDIKLYYQDIYYITRTSCHKALSSFESIVILYTHHMWH